MRSRGENSGRKTSESANSHEIPQQLFKLAFFLSASWDILLGSKLWKSLNDIAGDPASTVIIPAGAGWRDRSSITWIMPAAHGIRITHFQTGQLAGFCAPLFLLFQYNIKEIMYRKTQQSRVPAPEIEHWTRQASARPFQGYSGRINKISPRPDQIAAVTYGGSDR